MKDEVSVAVVPITDENRESLFRLAIAMRFDGSKCAYCGYKYQSVDDFIEHNPKAGYGEDEVVCQDCWGNYLKSYDSSTSKENLEES